jgi:hypothetical protein
VPPYYETKAYVARIVRDFNKKKLAAKSSTQPAASKSPANKSPSTASKMKPSPQAQAKVASAASSEKN